MSKSETTRATASGHRARRAYRIIKSMAQECGYMAHQYDTEGFERFCEVLEEAESMRPQDAELTLLLTSRSGTMKNSAQR